MILPPKDLINELIDNSTHQRIMEDVRYRVGWEKHQKAIKDREEAEVEKERLAYNQIDWHDFVVVQTVDFQPSETCKRFFLMRKLIFFFKVNLPPLCTPKDVGTRILLQQRNEAAKAATESAAMEIESDSEEEGEVQEKPIAHEVDVPKAKLRASYEVTQPTPAPPTAGNVVIREGYDPKKSKFYFVL